MSTLDLNVRSFSRKASSVKHNKKIVRTITYDDIVKLNKTIESKIHQNKRERLASMHAAAHCVVGGK